VIPSHTVPYLQLQRKDELRQEAVKLAEERRIAREQVMEWTKDAKMDSDEERERRPKKARKQKQDGSGDEAEPKKKRRGKLKKTVEQEDGEEQAIFSDDDDNEKPAKKVSLKARNIRLPDLITAIACGQEASNPR
jgi:RNA polymerase-associated protein CTR9